MKIVSDNIDADTAEDVKVVLRLLEESYGNAEIFPHGISMIAKHTTSEERIAAGRNPVAWTALLVKLRLLGMVC